MPRTKGSTHGLGLLICIQGLWGVASLLVLYLCWSSLCDFQTMQSWIIQDRGHVCIVSSVFCLRVPKTFVPSVSQQEFNPKAVRISVRSISHFISVPCPSLPPLLASWIWAKQPPQPPLPLPTPESFLSLSLSSNNNSPSPRAWAHSSAKPARLCPSTL